MRTKIISCICLLLASCFLFAGGKREDKDELGNMDIVGEESYMSTKEVFPDKIRISSLLGPTSIGMAWMFEYKPTMSAQVSMEVSASADILLPKLLKNEIDIAVLPTNVAAKVYNTNGKLLLASVVGNGMLFLVTNDDSIKSFNDLGGKVINVAGQGATPEYMIRYLANQKGLTIVQDEKDLTDTSIVLDFSIPTAEIAPSLISERIHYALVPEPFATQICLKGKNCIRALNIQEEYSSISGQESYPMTVCVVTKEFAEKYSSSLRVILQNYAQSIETAVAEPKETGLLMEKYNLGLKADVTEKAIPNANFVYTSAQDSKQAVESLLKVFLDFAPESIGRKLPDDGFYLAK